MVLTFTAFQLHESVPSPVLANDLIRHAVVTGITADVEEQWWQTLVAVPAVLFHGCAVALRVPTTFAFFSAVFFFLLIKAQSCEKNAAGTVMLYGTSFLCKEDIW